MPTIGGIVVATGSEGEGRTTLREVVDELARSVNPDDDTVRSQAAESFRAAVRTMNRRGNWPWEILEEDLIITANIDTSTLVNAVKKPLAMHLLSAAGGVRWRKLRYERYDVFAERYNQNLVGEPRTYTVPNLFETGQVKWFPIPSANNNARFTFWRVTPAPRNDDDVLEIPDTAMEAYKAFAWYEFVKRVPSGKIVMSVADAYTMARQAFREVSSWAANVGDKSRSVTPNGVFG